MGLLIACRRSAGFVSLKIRKKKTAGAPCTPAFSLSSCPGGSTWWWWSRVVVMLVGDGMEVVVVTRGDQEWLSWFTTVVVRETSTCDEFSHITAH